MDKAAIRQEMRRRRKVLSSEAQAQAAGVICGRILELVDRLSARDAFERGGTVAVYLASPDEVDLRLAIEGLLVRGIAVVAPRWNGAAYDLAKLEGLDGELLRAGPMGILEPKAADLASPKDVAIWLVPGLAFTRGGKRLGYGGGWYDRLMASADAEAMKIGIAHMFQMLDDLPSEPHDISVDCVLNA